MVRYFQNVVRTGAIAFGLRILGSSWDFLSEHSELIKVWIPIINKKIIKKREREKKIQSRYFNLS